MAVLAQWAGWGCGLGGLVGAGGSRSGHATDAQCAASLPRPRKSRCAGVGGEEQRSRHRCDSLLQQGLHPLARAGRAEGHPAGARQWGGAQMLTGRPAKQLPGCTQRFPAYTTCLFLTGITAVGCLDTPPCPLSTLSLASCRRTFCMGSTCWCLTRRMRCASQVNSVLLGHQHSITGSSSAQAAAAAARLHSV